MLSGDANDVDVRRAFKLWICTVYGWYCCRLELDHALMSLQLLDDIFSVNTTLQSNHTLQHLVFDSLDTEKGIQTHIDMSTYYRDQCKA